MTAPNIKILDITLLEAFQEPFLVDSKPRDIRLMERTGQPAKVVLRATQKLYKKGAIDYKDDIFKGWLTNYGEESFQVLKGLP